ncbi:histidine kinase N-terminal domain-containing protein [Brachybacterium sp. EF45031]|uniref:sensor histidine kinase n=1 Tax=Brachybacterium sillae TaxID=2810536 RepID=UPI00217DE1F1|nr:PAS domain-containing sensor histidine kinase [Brachybacterium sillae]MCS6710997.1 histidine kinase N-terminal domain-containing protein [Brachybacterium sillae]
MPSLDKFHSDTPGSDERSAQWLQLLVGDWSLASDLLRSDLVLWVARDGGAVAVAHSRPATGATVHYEDPVGEVVSQDGDPQLLAVLRGELDGTSPEPVDREARPALRQLVPVNRDGRTLAALSVESPRRDRAPSASDSVLHQLGQRLLRMVREGTYPIAGAPIPPRRGAPRVGDGTVQLDAQGVVTWCSPNALSAFHRFGISGDMTGRTLAELSTEVLQSRAPVDESLPLVLMGRAAWRSDMQARGGTLSLRAVPLQTNGVRDGAIILVRDVTELRRRERELMTKDATIREVHHRVKNNLQTVAALLRLQARRMTSDEARDALTEAMRRVSTIALVHESLLQGSEESVYLDEVIDRCTRLAVDAASASVHRAGGESIPGAGQVEVRTERLGRAGTVRAEEATPLALVITELATNAVEHGLAETGGTLTVRSERTGSHLVVHIEDDGVGMKGAPSGLGTNIAQTLVQGELGGTLTWAARPDGGTRATIDVYLDPISL